ncbi:hypothetical protein Drorol1_Dr00018979 [Drosera rotundifolia]
MELPLISRMSSCLETLMMVCNSNSLVLRILDSIFGESYQYSYRYWKWGPLFLAFILAFSNLASRINLRRFLLQHPLSSLSKPPPPRQATAAPFEQDDADSSSDGESDDDDDKEGCSSFCMSDEDREDSEFELDCDRDHESDDHKEAQARDQSKWRSRWGSVSEGLSELLGCNGVVKLWDESSDGEIWSNSDRNCDSFFDKISVIATPPLIVWSGVSDNRGKVMVNVWDTRVLSGRPAACGEGKTRRTGAVAGVGVGGGVDNRKVYCVSSDLVEGFVWDMRMFHLPLIHAAGL